MSVVISNILFADRGAEVQELDSELYVRTSIDTSSPYVIREHKSKIFILKGEIYNYSFLDLGELLCRGRLQELSRILGEFTLVVYDKEYKKICILNDKTGRETFYYYVGKDGFALSDSFWEIVDIINPSEDDIDLQSLKEYLVFYYPLFYKTIIKGLEVFPPACLGVYNLQQRKFVVEKYWDLRYNIDPTRTLQDAVSELDEGIDAAFRYIRMFSGEDKLYGVGISGGLDSRIIPYYARRHGFSLVGFIIGESKPHRVLLSRDHISATRVAAFYDLPLHCVDISEEPVKGRLKSDVRYYPIGTPQFMTNLRRSVPEFDVLLTGATGILVGAELPRNICYMSVSEVLVEIIQHFSLLHNTTEMDRVLKLLDYMGIKKREQRAEVRYQVPNYIVKREELEAAIGKIEDFVSTRKHKSPVEIFQEYFLHVIASRNKYGAYESLQGRQKSYSIYVPFVLEASLSWSPRFLIGRKILKELVRSKVRDLSSIGPQGYETSIRNEGHILAPVFKLGSVIEFLVRGRGVDNLDRWLYRRESIKMIRHVLFGNENSLFTESVDLRRVYDDFLRRRIPVKLLAKIVKAKYLLDVIFSKEYKSFR